MNAPPDAPSPRPSALAGIAVRVEAASSCEDAEVFALRVLGDSMLPEFEDGDIVVVEPGGRVDEGAFVIARVAGEWALRQLRREGAGWVLVALAQPAAVEPLSDLAAIRGVVIQKSKPGRRSTLKRYV